MTRQRPTARELLTPTSEKLLATVYAGQVRAVVIERTLRRMAQADQRMLQGSQRRHT
ncbi:hypothetical protein HZZ00_11020 [Streptomyces sp. NEAU-sy36]|uniref:hypothetical protein n=1 Tax=unclassified Streptomyces TaxID=2593676 RepID=UPI0015D59B4F|nr:MULTISPECIES: hypothetical protein [unclassified Streptomyces]QLJ01502.1 hypothetical protein HZZ00_11020 [Streptomyces sp. NEAU-sy36]